MTLCLATITGAIVCAAYAPRGPDESMKLMRVQIELIVCDLPNAGSKDPLAVTLGGAAGSARATWLDHPRQSLERGGQYRYDLSLDDVFTLADITELGVSKSGTDDLCLRELTLLVNQTPIFVRAFNGGLWLNSANRNAVRVTRAELRTNALWQSYDWSLSEWIASTGGSVSAFELVERLQSCVATAMHDLGLTWRSGSSAPMRLRRRDDTTVAATVVLTHPVAHWIDVDVVLDFDLAICSVGRAQAAITKVTVREAIPWYAVAIGRKGTRLDQRLSMTLRDRLVKSRPLVFADGICPHVDRAANIAY